MSKEKKLPKRSEIPGKWKWKLEDLYPSGEAWEQDYRRIREAIPDIETSRGSLCQSAEQLLKGLNVYFEWLERAERLFVYASMKRDEDNGNPESQALLDRAREVLTAGYSAASFLVPEILSIPRNTLRDFMKSCEGLKVYDQYLDEITRRKEHYLSDREEEILALAGEMAAAPRNIFSMINNADIRFPEVHDENGEKVELTKGRYTQMMGSRDREVRKEAFQAFYTTYAEQKNAISAALNASVKKDIFFSQVRHYPSDLEASLDEDNVPKSVYDHLIEAVGQNLDAMYRYVDLKKRALQVKELHMYDVYAPIVKGVDWKFSYDRAKEIVAEGLEPLGTDYQNILQKGFAGGWIDVMENEGKTSGGYSQGVYGVHPYVLLNYQGNIDSVFTLAHEMGHSIHSYLSGKNQPFAKAEYRIFVAEVASTLNEILLTEHLLHTLKDPKQKAYILNHYLEQFRTTVYRQTMFAEFEKIIHNMAESGQPLTCESMSSVYRDLNIRYYGRGMHVDEEISMEWMRIPHFYRSFYVYKYSTGFCAAAALANQIRKEGKPAVERYLRFLSSGGSDYPINLLKKAGVDMTSTDPVNTALKSFDGMIGQLDELL